MEDTAKKTKKSTRKSAPKKTVRTATPRPYRYLTDYRELVADPFGLGL